MYTVKIDLSSILMYTKQTSGSFVCDVSFLILSVHSTVSVILNLLVLLAKSFITPIVLKVSLKKPQFLEITLVRVFAVTFLGSTGYDKFPLPCKISIRIGLLDLFNFSCLFRKPLFWLSLEPTSDRTSVHISKLLLFTIYFIRCAKAGMFSYISIILYINILTSIREAF